MVDIVIYIEDIEYFLDDLGSNIKAEDIRDEIDTLINEDNFIRDLINQRVFRHIKKIVKNKT